MELCDPAVSRVTGRARFAYLAVDAAGGPHVTPVLFAATQDRLWFAVPRGTLKARVLAKRPEVGVLIPDRSSAVAVTGEGSLLDPVRPASLGTRLPELARAPFALPSYGLRNADELVGFARDAALQPVRSSAGDLVLVSVRPRTIELVPPPPVPRPARRRPDVTEPLETALAQLPGEIAALATRPGPAVLGWLTPRGPVALPAHWEPGRARVRWSGLAGLRPPTSGPACLCLDVTRGSGPGAKQGLLLRGRGRADTRGAVRSVSVDPDRLTYWDGFETGTVPV
jgi:hypothetical protein